MQEEIPWKCAALGDRYRYGRVTRDDGSEGRRRAPRNRIGCPTDGRIPPTPTPSAYDFPDRNVGTPKPEAAK